MKIKEILPWSIESPVIHLVQPSPTIPLGHEVVFQQKISNGAGVNSIFALAALEKETRRQKRARQEKRKEFKEKKESNLSCGFISPHIQPEMGEKKKNNSFYDLRNHRSMSIAIDQTANKSNLTNFARSKSLDISPLQERRKTSPDFEDILKDLACESRLGSDTGESYTSKASTCSDTSQRGYHDRRNIDRENSTNTEFSSESVFYDVSLDDPDVERSSASPQTEIYPRKSFSEETFDRNKMNLIKERVRIWEKVNSKPRTTSSDSCDEDIWREHDKRRVSQMVDDLLFEIYGDKSLRLIRRRSCLGILRQNPSLQQDYQSYEDHTEYTSGSETNRLFYLQRKGVAELREIRDTLQADVKRLGGRLAKQLVHRDCYQAKRDWHCDWITAYLQANSEKRSEDTKTRFSVVPSPGDSGFTQWQNGMRMVARLPEGIPPQFRKTLWLNLAEKHLASRGVQWQRVEEFCFNEFTNPDDEELGVQIVKDVHRTGCSLFCGVSGKDNQALLKRVLLAYARWNKAVGYCQGFNMLAALILQVMDKSEVDSVKVMIFLIEGVLPESYFANNLRGLSVDMAVFRDLLRIKLPTLSRHFDQLQCDSKDSGTSYEPPLTNVFTMQWFLTLFCNCLPQDTVLRVWDLIFLEGNHVLLCTALAIWSTLADRILSVESADEFYCIMGVLTREMLEFGLMDANALIKAIVSFNLPELAELREKYLYNITPWTQSVSTVARRGLRLFYSDDDTDTEEDDEKIAIATAYGLFRSPKKKEGASGVTSPPRALTCPDKERIAMDISALTKQYRKLRERQKQAHVILTAACGSQGLVGPTPSPAMNHLLMGKFALVNSKGRRLGPPPGSIPPPSQPRTNPNEKQNIIISGETLHWKDTVDGKKSHHKDSDEEKSPESSPSKSSSRRGSSSSSSTELCDDPQRFSDSEDQSNSLSESYILSDKPESSIPLKSPQPKPKPSHPADVESCREAEEPSENKESDNFVLEHTDPDVKPKESLLSVSPDGDENKAESRRKPSFRIDPEELRELDRKLSLKIVEIERRRSSAGIESEDLNSKVLFPFDRDYIQEGERTDRDTPSSIPDDRMCCTDDFEGYEEETIIVPDIITTHRPLGFRMSSLEECDETKASEAVDLTEDTQKGSFDENETELKSYIDTESSDGNDENEESQHSLICTTFNFDELFNNKKINNSDKCMDDSSFETSHRVTLDHLTNHLLEQKKDLIDKNTTSNLKSTTFPQELKLELQIPSGIAETSNDLNSNKLSGLEGLDSTNISDIDSFHPVDDKRTDFSVSKGNNNANFNLVNDRNSIFHSDDQHSEESNALTTSSVLKNTEKSLQLEMKQAEKQTENQFQGENLNGSEILVGNVHSKSISPNINDPQKALERKLANLVPKIPLLSSFDSSLPDLTTVTSRDAAINSIREKYANLAQSDTTKTVEVLNTNEFQSIKSLQFPKSLLLNYTCDNEEINTTSLDVEVSQIPKEDLSKINVTEEVKEVETNMCELESKDILQSNVLTSKQDGTTDDASEHLTKEIFEINLNTSNELGINTCSDGALKLSGKQEFEMNSNELDLTASSSTNMCLTSKTKDEEVMKNKLQTEEFTFEDYINKQSTSSNRRGSEVALNLILKENSQILSKIHHQSRRCSEIPVSSKYLLENVLNNETDPIQNTENTINIEAEIENLNRTIYNDGNNEKLPQHISSTNSSDILGTSVDDISKEESLISTEVSSEKERESQAIKNIVSEETILPHESFMGYPSNVLSSEFKSESLPDVCIFDRELNKISIYGESTKTSNLSDSSHKYSSHPNLESKESQSLSKDTSPKGFDVKDLTEPYRNIKRASVMSPTKEVEEDSPPGTRPTKFKETFHANESSTGLSTFRDMSEEVSKKPLPYSFNEPYYKSELNSIKYSPDTNEDILKELRYLDIKPEETLDYSNPKSISLSPVTPSDSYYLFRENNPNQKASDLPGSSDQQYNYSSTKQTSFGYSSDGRASRSIFRKSYKDHKATSLDTATLDKIMNDKYLDETCKSLVRSATVTEDDNSLYMNSYKNHGRLLVDKGELDTHMNLDEYSKDTNQVWCNDRKTLDSSDGSAYDFKKSCSAKENPSYSQFLSMDSNSLEEREIERREKLLVRYKSEDLGRSVSPSRYRFSSASPIRKRLDTLSNESSLTPYSTISRTKSPSPTSYNSSSLPLASEKNAFETNIPNIAYSDSKEYKKYSKTESLDLSLNSDRRTGFFRKRAESFETSTLDKFSEEKKSLSPSSPVKFNPFPVRSSSRQPKELGVKLGLYLPPKSDKSPNKHT